MTMFMGNRPYHDTEADLRQAFETFGHVGPATVYIIPPIPPPIP